jgi:Zn-finger domain-containing protein
MNRNARRKITVNSGSVDENFKLILEQLLLSERVMVNGLPAKIVTNDAELYKIVNKKDLNYTLEFEYAYDEVSTIY